MVIHAHVSIRSVRWLVTGDQTDYIWVESLSSSNMPSSDHASAASDHARHAGFPDASAGAAAAQGGGGGGKGLA